MKVYVAAEETQVLGVYSTKEKAQARCDEWSSGAVHVGQWYRYDGAWRREVRHVEDENLLTQRVTEDVVDDKETT